MGVKVLVVEDDDVMAESLRAALSADKAVTAIRVTADPADAVTEARNFRPDIVVIDAIGMDMPGNDVGTRIRAIRAEAVMVSFSGTPASPTWADVSILKDAGGVEAIKKVVERSVSEPEKDELRTFIHDLRNPIGALTGFVHLIQTQRASLSQEQFDGIIEGIARSASRLGRIVDEFSEKHRA